MVRCSVCEGELSDRFRFCPWCAAPQRLKLVEFFRSSPEVEPDRRQALRVSRYVGAGLEPSHTRFSVWDETGRAESAISLAPDEAERLARFLTISPSDGPPRRTLLDRVLEAVRAARDLLRGASHPAAQVGAREVRRSTARLAGASVERLPAPRCRT